MTNMYRIVGEGDGNPLLEHDFKAWQAAKDLDPELARQIVEDSLATQLAIRRGLVSQTNGLPMPLVSSRILSSRQGRTETEIDGKNSQ